MNTFVFQPGMTWRKLGYGFFSDSLAYREVLEQNPQWSVTEIPAPGTVLHREATISSSGMSQQPSIFGRPSGEITLDYYPFNSEYDYYLSLSGYSRSALKDVERLNGWSINSLTVESGITG